MVPVVSGFSRTRTIRIVLAAIVAALAVIALLMSRQSACEPGGPVVKGQVRIGEDTPGQPKDHASSSMPRDLVLPLGGTVLLPAALGEIQLTPLGATDLLDIYLP